MSDIAPRLVMIGLGAAVSPVAVMVLISLMLRKHALRNALFFLLGFTPTLLALGYVFVYLLHVGGSGGKSDIDGYIDIALGVICLLAIILVYAKKPKEKKTEEDISASRAGLIGCLTMLANYSTLIIFVSGIHVISAAKLPLLEDVLSVALLTLVTLWTLLVPVGIYVVAPSKAEKMLAALRDWLSKHNKEISAAILLVFAVLLIIKGIREF
jgi:hypothetical protein